MPHPARPLDGHDDIVIRGAQPDDAEAMGAFLVPTWLDAHRRHVPDEVWQRRRREWTPEVSAAAWQRTLTEIDATTGHPSTVLVAERATDGAVRVVGLGMVTVAGDTTAHVDALYAAREVRRSGVGRALLGRLATVAADDGAASVETVVLAANTAARAFYERYDGEVVGDGTFVDDGVELATVVYRWPTSNLVDGAGTR